MKPIYWILILIVMAAAFFFFRRRNGNGSQGKTVRINWTTAELEQYASDMCEGVYENQGVQAFNDCRNRFIEANS